MAAGRRKQVKKYKFELTRGAIGGIGIVCFCIFLWLFLLGVWTGQSLLMPALNSPDTDIIEPQKIIDLADQKKHKPQDR